MLPDEIKIKDIKPALSGYIAESLRLLKKPSFPDEDAVHDIRVLMKKSRAIMKLLSPQIDQESFARDYSAFKDAGQILASWRDTSVQRKTLKAVRKSNRELFSRLGRNRILDDILNKTELPLEHDLETTGKITALENILKKSLYRIRFYSINNPDFRLLYQELDKSYRTVSKIYLDCRHNPKPLKIHKFRKRLKDFLYQVYFFRPLNQHAIKNIEKRLDNMAQNLGKYNDITQIINFLGYKYGDPENTPALDEFIALLKGMQDEYLIKVWPDALKIFRPGQKLQALLGFRLLIL